MVQPCDQSSIVKTNAIASSSNGSIPPPGATATVPRPEPNTHNLGRKRYVPIRVEATVYWWRNDERKAGCVFNQFGIMPATPVRFRCIGTMTAKYPQRYRVELARALDWLPDLAPRELKDLGASLAATISKILDVDVAQIGGEVFDLDMSSADN